MDRIHALSRDNKRAIIFGDKQQSLEMILEMIGRHSRKSRPCRVGRSDRSLSTPMPAAPARGGSRVRVLKESSGKLRRPQSRVSSRRPVGRSMIRRDFARIPSAGWSRKAREGAPVRRRIPPQCSNVSVRREVACTRIVSFRTNAHGRIARSLWTL